MRFDAVVILLVAATMLMTSSCVSHIDSWEVRADNRERLKLLGPGMTKDEVLAVMGTESIEGPDGEINNPFRTEMFSHESSIYDVLYYYTDKKTDDNAITDDELTPIVFKDGIIHGWGWISLRKLIHQTLAPPPSLDADVLP